MWKILIPLLAVVVLYKMITNDSKKKKGDDKKDTERKIARGELVKDPQCGTYVTAEGSITIKDGAQMHHFCSYECRSKFLEVLEADGRELPLHAKTEEKTEEKEDA